MARAEGIRLDELPRRVEWAEVGSITLPRFVFTWLQTSRNEDWTVADMGMLAAMLGMFENQISLFPNAAFEEEDGEPVLVVQGDADNIRFSRTKTCSRRIPLRAAGMSANGWRYRNSYGTAGSRYRRHGYRAADQARRAGEEGARGEGGEASGSVSSVAGCRRAGRAALRVTFHVCSRMSSFTCAVRATTFLNSM